MLAIVLQVMKVAQPLPTPGLQPFPLPFLWAHPVSGPMTTVPGPVPPVPTSRPVGDLKHLETLYVREEDIFQLRQILHLQRPNAPLSDGR